MPMWYYTRDRKSRIGPVEDAQLKQLIAGRQLEASDVVWRDGLAAWVSIAQVPELAVALPGAAQPAPVPVTPAPVQAIPGSPARQVVPVAVQPAPVQPTATGPIPVAPVPAASAQAAAAIKGGLAAIGGLFKKAATAVTPPRAPAAVAQAPAPTVAAVVPARQAAVLPANDALSARDTGDFEPEQFSRCREYLREAGIRPDELVFFCNTRTRLSAGAAGGLLGMVSSQQQARAVLHLALTLREVALVHVGEGGKVVLERAPHEGVSWKFADAEEASKPSGLAAASGLFKRDQPPPERIELLRLELPSGEQELRFTPGAGLDALRRRAAEVFHARARAFFAEGKCYLAEYVLRHIEPGLVAGEPLDALRKQVSAVAEAAAHYQGGHPEFLDGFRGVLRLDPFGLEFVPVDAGLPTMRVPYDGVLDVIEPQRGDFPDEMVRGSENKKTAGRAVGMAASFAGVAMSASGVSGAKLVSGVGKTVASDLKESAVLGAPPKNRLCVVLLLDGVKYRLLFDVVAGAKDEMEQRAKTFWSRSAAVRARFFRPGAPAPRPAVVRPARAALPAPAAEGKAPVVVGCPKCRSKLRAHKPGVVQCPKCQAKVRVAESKFQDGQA